MIIRATAGVAFRITNAADSAAWWREHTTLLRRLIAAQSMGGYENHPAHLAVLRRGEEWARYFAEDGPPPSKYAHITREDMHEVLTDFGPRHHAFGEHPKRQGVYGWWPRLEDCSFVGRSGRHVAAALETERRIEATIPPEAPGTPALPPPPKAETPEQRLARLKRALVPLAAVYYDTLPAQLPQDVIDILVDIAELSGGDMTQAIAAWREACDLAEAE
jgi:hypothetical protein